MCVCVCVSDVCDIYLYNHTVERNSELCTTLCTTLSCVWPPLSLASLWISIWRFKCWLPDISFPYYTIVKHTHTHTNVCTNAHILSLASIIGYHSVIHVTLRPNTSFNISNVNPIAILFDVAYSIVSIDQSVSFSFLSLFSSSFFSIIIIFYICFNIYDISALVFVFLFVHSHYSSLAICQIIFA